MIDDWYDNGELDEPHRCRAVRTALERVPTSGTSITAPHEDLLEYAERVC